MASAQYKANVVVVGGGPAGLNAALDLAAQGFHVDLVEKSPELGGLVGKLHRLYPLCSCCKVTNRATACAQETAISVWTEAQVSAVSGKAGDFTVTVTGPEGSRDFSAGAVILAPGLDTFNPSVYDTYAYSQYPNVVTSLDLESLQKPTGPTQGVVKRPSDGKAPKRVAWLQCVGSREINKCDAPFCSTICCMGALKEATQLRQSDPEAETTIFFMDIRSHGKGHERYLNAARELGVRPVYSRIHSVEPVWGSDDLSVGYVTEAGEKIEEVYDMVVLSVGLRPSPEMKKLADMLGVALTADSFAGSAHLAPAETNVPGVFVCGGTTGPRDVHQSVIEAAAAVAKTAALFPGEAPATVRPPMRDVSGEAPSVGVVMSLCPTRASGFEAVWSAVAPEIEKLPGVAFVSALALENAQAFGKLAEALRSQKANRLIFASCSPIMHKDLVEWALAEAGLNPSLYDFIDLRTLGATPAEAGRLTDLFRAAVVRARLLEPGKFKEIPVKRAALVIGGGLAGMEAALAFAAQKVPVTIVERKDELGGHALKVRSTWTGAAVPPLVAEKVKAVKASPLVTVMTGATVTDARGFAGNYTSVVSKNGTKASVEHGVVVIATGGHSLKPAEYLYGQHPSVYRWSDLSKKMVEDPKAFAKAKSAVFIQCVGSRDATRPYCSRLCCSFSIRTAIDLKAANPDMDVFILYRDVMSFGERENIYKEAREKGVLFVRYGLDAKPKVTATPEGGLEVRVLDHVLRRELVISPDFVSLQSAIYPEDVSDLARIYKVTRDEDGFFKESPQKMRPVDGETEGVYFAGLALSPKPVEESLTDAWAVAGRAMSHLVKKSMLVGGAVAEVLPDKCAVCLTCVRTCPFSIPFIDSAQGASYIDPGLCQGCGMCVSECPAKAITFTRQSDDQVAAVERAFFEAAN